MHREKKLSISYLLAYQKSTSVLLQQSAEDRMISIFSVKL